MGGRPLATSSIIAFAALAFLSSLSARAEEAKLTYADNVRPVFREHCFACHNQNKATNDLALDSYERLMKGGASGEVIAPGDLDSSYLWSLVSHQDQPNMPPNQDKLPDAKLDLIKRWIMGGALKDSGSTAAAPKKPALDLGEAAGAERPAGAPILPEGLFRQPAVYTPRPAAVTAIAASPWAPVVAIAGQRQIVLYGTQSGELLGVLPFSEGIPYVLKFSRSGALLLAGGGVSASRGLVVVYDVKTGKRLFDVGDELDAVLAADISADHSLVALGGPQKIVRVFSTADGSQVCEIHKHTDWIEALEFSPDGVLLASGDRAGGLWVWEAGTDREFYNLEGHKAGVTDLSWRSDSNVLASASEDGTIKLWSMDDGRQLKSLSAHGPGVTSLWYAHDGRLASAGRDKVAKLWDAQGKEVRTFEAFPDIALRVALAHDAARLIAGDWTGEVRMFDTADGKIVARLASNPPTLEMRIQEAQAKAAEAQAASAKAAAELGDADKALSDKQQAAKQAAPDAQAAATAEAAEAEKARNDKAQAAQAAADAAAAAQSAAEKLVAEKAAWEKAQASTGPAAAQP